MTRGGSSTKAPTLHELQSRLQAAILDGDDSVLAWIPGNSRTTRDTLFGVYRHAYRGRLIEILGNDYPKLRALAGAAEFQELALAFVNAFPSRTPNARWFGARFPEFLASRATSVRRTLYAELASIEKALSDAFDSADASVLTLTDLAQVPPDAWARLVFLAHPSVSVRATTTNAFAVWRALNQDKTPPRAASRKAGETLMIWRQDARPLVRQMTYEDAMIWTEASKGASFGALCEILSTYDDPDTAAGRAASYLHGWLTSGMLSCFAITPDRKIEREALELEWHAP